MTKAATAFLYRRKALGLSQRQAAGALGVCQSTVAFAESGRWSVSDARLARMLAALDIWESNQKPEGDLVAGSARPAHTRQAAR